MAAITMLLWVSLTLAIATFDPVFSDSICNRCDTGSPATNSPVINYCHDEHLNLTSNHRCCVNSSVDNTTDANIVGVDLSNCSLQNVTGVFKNMLSVVIISLEKNPLVAVADDDFYELTELETLILPAEVKYCPGGGDAWNTSESQNDTLLCQGQVNSCHTAENNETCPATKSYCAAAGPGLVDCLCSPGYHGYKCLRQGTFPLIPFVGGITGSTFVTALFLWVTQRRFVKKSRS